jgi:hydroxyacylglutathione hydrolase
MASITCVLESLLFRQLLAGHDFATDDTLAQTMRNHTYVVGDAGTGEVLLVDPAYDVIGLFGYLAKEHLKLVGVIATHYHADHVGGEILGERIEGLVELLEKADVPVHVQKDEVAWVAEMTGAPVSALVAHSDDDVVEVGNVFLRLLHTPGHSAGSQCILVDDNLMTGDTLFIEGCGRTDLPGGDPADMYTSLRRLAALPGRTKVWPGHHYAHERSSLIEVVRATNRALLDLSDRAEWLRTYGPS